MDTELDLEYIEFLIEKASRKTDSPMIVQWLPYVIQLVAEVKRLRANEGRLFKERQR